MKENIIEINIGKTLNLNYKKKRRNKMHFQALQSNLNKYFFK